MREIYRNQAINKSRVVNGRGIPLPEKPKIARLTLPHNMSSIRHENVVVGYIRNQGECNTPPLRKAMQLMLNNAILGYYCPAEVKADRFNA